MQLMPKLDSVYLFVADPEQMQTLFIMSTVHPYVIARVIYIATRMDWDMMKHRKPHFFKVPGYNIVIAHETSLETCPRTDDIVFTLPNMATTFLKHQVQKKPLKYGPWKEGMVPVCVG